VPRAVAWRGGASPRVCLRCKQVVLNAGDVLYIPAHWFHYIVSLTTNVQCNSRSGTPDTYADSIQRCGFGVRVTEGVPAACPACAVPAVQSVGDRGVARC
jgi:hypothetical protein